MTRTEIKTKIEEIRKEIERLEDQISATKDLQKRQSLQNMVNDLVAEREFYLDKL